MMGLIAGKHCACCGNCYSAVIVVIGHARTDASNVIIRLSTHFAN